MTMMKSHRTWENEFLCSTQDMASADLIISHAGAGTCLEVLQLYCLLSTVYCLLYYTLYCTFLEVLELGKPLVVIVNSRLMGNHQVHRFNFRTWYGIFFFLQFFLAGFNSYRSTSLLTTHDNS